MDAKIKAKELVDKFYKIINDKYDQDIIKYIGFIKVQNTEEAKQLALIAVDEILQNFGSVCEGKMFYSEYRTIKYYQEVKNEINKLKLNI